MLRDSHRKLAANSLSATDPNFIPLFVLVHLVHFYRFTSDLSDRDFFFEKTVYILRNLETGQAENKPIRSLVLSSDDASDTN